MRIMQTTCFIATLGVLGWVISQGMKEGTAGAATSTERVSSERLLDAKIVDEKPAAIARRTNKAEKPVIDDAPAIEPGANKAEVLTVLGSPMAKSADDAMWMYGNYTVMFRDDRVMGWVKPDAGATARIEAGDEMRKKLAKSEPTETIQRGLAGMGQSARSDARKANRPNRWGMSVDRWGNVQSPRYTAPGAEIFKRMMQSGTSTFRQPEWLRSYSSYRDAVRRDIDNRDRRNGGQVISKTRR